MGVLLLLLLQVSAAEMKALLRPTREALVVHAWASWCGPCLSELPELAEGLRKRRADVVWVNLDEKPAAAERISKRIRLPGRSVRPATAEAMAALRSLDEKWDGELPGTWLIAADGNVVLAQRGSSDPAALWKLIEQTRRGK